MKTNVVSWFELPVEDMNRAKKFYSNVLKKELMDMSMGPEVEMAAFPWVENGAHAAGALIKTKGVTPSSTGSVVYFQCENLNNELERVELNGGKVVVGKTEIPGGFGFFARFIDSEGNLVALSSSN